jgi:adenylate cyclase
MNEAEMKALQAALDLKQKELGLIMAIDELRDTISEPEAMLTAIVELLAERLEADACLMFLLDRETGEVALRATAARTQAPGAWQPAITPELAERAMRLDEIALWEGVQELPPASLEGMPEGMQLAAVPVFVRADERLGALLLARSQAPFGPDDVQLLRTAEDQIDSAVIQSFVYDRQQQSVREAGLMQRELEMVVAIDELRDTVPEPVAMLTSIVELLAERLEADSCLMFLLDRETGEVELRAATDRTQQLGRLQRIITPELAERAMRLDDVAIWNELEDLPAGSPLDLPEGMQLAAVPIYVGAQERLGALLLARSQAPFYPDEVQLLRTAEDQIDSAVIQGYLYQKNQNSATEIETIYQIDRIRDQDLSMSEMLNRVLQVLIDKISAQMGFIMLYDETGKQLERRATTHEDLFQIWGYCETVEQVVAESLERAELVCRNDLSEPLRSMMCLPLILNEQIIGVLGVVNRYGSYGFTAADCRLLRAIGSQIDTAIYERRAIRRLRKVLGRSVDPRVMERLLSTPDVDILKPERLEMTVLYADMRGSTPLAEQTEPELLVEFIRDYLTQMTEVVLSLEGTIDKFVGDSVMALFGAPIPQADHALRAVRAGIKMQAVYQGVVRSWWKRGLLAPPIGIGIATGRMIAGEMGGSQRADYTVMGRDVNLGARICGLAKGGQVLVSEATYEMVKAAVEAIALPNQQFKGVADNVTVYQVTEVAG